MKKKLTALVLQGGGPLGAFEYGACKALFEQKNFKPDIISGVSVGAIQASIIGGSKSEDSMEALGEFWEKCSTQENPFISKEMNININKYNNPGWYKLKPEVFFTPEDQLTSKLDISPLYSNLDNLIDKKKLNNTDINVVVTATNIETGEIEEFDNQGQEPLTFDHIVASASIPPYVEAVEIEQNFYWDGALFSNMPLSPAFSRLEKIETSEEVEREIILIEVFPKTGPLPKTYSEIQDRMRHIQYASKVHNETKQFDSLNNYIEMVKQLDRELPSDSKVRKMKGFKELLHEKKINKVTIIEHSEPETLDGIFDYTKSTINKRIEQGYNDTMEHLSSVA